jgi:hypothetical protein
MAGPYTVVGRQPKLDGRRAYQGRPQLSKTDWSILDDAHRLGLHICIEGGETVFRLGDGRKARAQNVVRLRQLGYLIDADDRLFPDAEPQTLLRNITPPPFDAYGRSR